MTPPEVHALMNALRRLLRTWPSESDLLNAIGYARTEEQFNAAWQRWYWDGDA